MNEPDRRLEFDPEPYSFFMQCLLSGLSLLVYFPAAAHVTDLVKMLASRMWFADGTKVSYVGEAADLQKPLLLVSRVIWLGIVLRFLSGGLVGLVVMAVMSILAGCAGYAVLLVVASRLETNIGSRLNRGSAVDCGDVLAG